ncbi:hypothetical protein [Gemmiger sp.]|uniref:hypothetical protein n=1 Tax=Gemmiger sp. TaxID=2049027 RepID=UPI00307F0825
MQATNKSANSVKVVLTVSCDRNLGVIDKAIRKRENLLSNLTAEAADTVTILYVGRRSSNGGIGYIAIGKGRRTVSIAIIQFTDKTATVFRRLNLIVYGSTFGKFADRGKADQSASTVTVARGTAAA